MVQLCIESRVEGYKNGHLDPRHPIPVLNVPIWTLRENYSIMLKLPQIGLRQTVNVAEYLFTRLSQVGIRSVHGVPGDYNIAALDYLHQANLKWVGNTNELNAGTLYTLPDVVEAR